MDMPREGSTVRKDIVVPNIAIVRNVNANHQEVSRANARSRAFPARAVDSDMFSNQIVVANFKIAGLSHKLYILRFAPDYSMFEDPVALSKTGIAANYCMGA